MSREFSCEHCGRAEVRQAPRHCDHGGCSMCFDCTEDHDSQADDFKCPNAHVAEARERQGPQQGETPRP
jgi:hypothetical protein